MTLTLMPLFLISMPGGGEIIVIAVVIIVLFGAKKIPEFARGIGKGIKEFKDAKDGDDTDDDNETGSQQKKVK